MGNSGDIYEERAAYSRSRLARLRQGFEGIGQLNAWPGATVFAAGSYARLEASEYSDIDLFFLRKGNIGSLTNPRQTAIQVFGEVIKLTSDLGYPPFSSDCEYLELLHTEDIVTHLGGRTDDHRNFFTVRMLLLLESNCVFGSAAHDAITADIVRSYFYDFPDHQMTFEPTFLLNDICRFWKTLLLNYENKRNPSVPGDAQVEGRRKTKQKVRNFKLKFSRMTTCFATIAALGSHEPPVTEEAVLAVTKLTPIERLRSVETRLPQLSPDVQDILGRYSWFLQMTGKPTEELEGHFKDKTSRTDMFGKASEYGDAMYRLLQSIDGLSASRRLLRTLVI